MSALSYRDIALVPRYSTLRSRAEADVSVEFLGRRLESCVLPANMTSVINEDIAKWLSESNHGYIYHRFSDTLEFVRRANQENWKLVSISVGVKQGDRDLLTEIVKQGLRVDWITIDVAMGHHVLVKEMIEFIKGLEFSKKEQDSWSAAGAADPLNHQYCPKIIAGNVATPKAVQDLTEWGASAIKVGVAGGMSCHTRQKTAFHVPMFTCAKTCYEEGGGWGYATEEVTEGTWLSHPAIMPAKVPLIFDGGVREIGDVVKALVAGGGAQNLVMAGSLFAACVDAPGENVYTEKRVFCKETGYVGTESVLTHKRMHGSASSRQKGKRLHVEGIELEIPCNGMTIESFYQDIRESLQSACSYAGATNLAGLKDVQYIEIK